MRAGHSFGARKRPDFGLTKVPSSTRRKSSISTPSSVCCGCRAASIGVIPDIGCGARAPRRKPMARYRYLIEDGDDDVYVAVLPPR